MNLIELKKDSIDKFGYENILRAFQYVDENNNQIGYSLILNEEENEVIIYIEKKYRGNGYGTNLFKNTLEVINKEIKVKTKNDIMKIIINKYNGLRISTRNGYAIYVVPKINS